MYIAVREESSLAADSIRESSNESFNHSQDSIANVSDTAEFSDDDDVPAGKYSWLLLRKYSWLLLRLSVNELHMQVY